MKRIYRVIYLALAGQGSDIVYFYEYEFTTNFSSCYLTHKNFNILNNAFDKQVKNITAEVRIFIILCKPFRKFLLNE